MKNRIKKIWLITLIILPIFILITSQYKTTTPTTLNVGMVLSNIENPFFQAINTGAQNEAANLAINLKVLDSNDSSALELEMVKKLINEGIDLLILNPTDADAVYPAVRYANLKQIPVITIDRISSGGEILCHIASDNEAGGRMAAEFMLKSTQNQGKYAVLRGIEGASASLMRYKGFQEKLATQGKMTQAASLVASFDRERGRIMTEKLIQVHPDLKALFAENDEMALGAIEAFSKTNLSPIIIGFDGTPEAKAAVVKGQLAATIAQQPELLGIEAIRQSHAYLSGMSVPETVLVNVMLVEK